MTGRVWAVLAVVVASALAACNGGEGTVDAGPAPSVTTSAPTSTSTPPATGPSGPAATSAPRPATTTVSVYLTRGESLENVSRTVPRVPRVGAEAVKALLRGPTARETAAGLGTAIPDGTRFLGLTIDGGTAKVDLSREFESGGGTLGLTLRLAQVVCTLDQFDSVTGVRFALEGKLVSVFSGNGIVLDRPVTCQSYRQYLRGGRTPVHKDGIPQVTASPTRGTVGTRVHIEGAGFTDRMWREGGDDLWLVGDGGDGCSLYAQGQHSVRIGSDGLLTGHFVVPARGGCRQEGREADVRPGRYSIAYRCTPCFIGAFDVTG